MNLSQLKPNPDNPRRISEAAFEKLRNSLNEFPKMLELRPIVYDPETMYVLGGNMRLKALIDLGFDEIPDEWVKSADELTEQEKRRFVISDNVDMGEWNPELLQSDYTEDELDEWGLVFDFGIQDSDIDEIKLPDDKQDEPDVFEGFVVVLKINYNIYSECKDDLNSFLEKYGIKADIS